METASPSLSATPGAPPHPAGRAAGSLDMSSPTSGVVGESHVPEPRERPPAARDDDVAPQPPATNEEQQLAHSHHYIFKRLRRDVPAPSRKRLWLITTALCMSMVLCGWNDGSVGPLIPSLQEYYNINYLIMSLLYILMFVGALIGGLGNVWITDRLGFGLTSVIAALAVAVGYALAGSGGPYALFLISYVLNGFAGALQDAQINNITTRLPNADFKMSIVQASFSLGGTIAPFISTAFAAHVKAAYRYFFVAMGVALFTAALMYIAFEGKTEEQLVGKLPKDGEKDDDVEMGTEPEKRSETAVVDAVGAQHASDESRQLGPTTSRTTTHEPKIVPTESVLPPLDAEKLSPDSSGRKMMRIFTTPAAWALIVWAFLYVGVEVAISGWLTTFLRRERGGSASAGYVVTGFWGGMSVGRLVLIPITRIIGYQVSIYICASVALALELVIWFTHSLVGNGVCYAFVGFFLGPIYPNALMVLSEILDDDLRSGVMGLMGSMGGAGAAAIPFMTGGISDKYGIWTLQPIAVSMIAGFTALWLLVPRKRITSKRVTQKQ